jgi:hypothetical protein
MPQMKGLKELKLPVGNKKADMTDRVHDVGT